MTKKLRDENKDHADGERVKSCAPGKTVGIAQVNERLSQEAGRELDLFLAN